MLKVISFGELLVDMLSERISGVSNDVNERFVKFPGGAPANVAAAVSRLGGDSYFAGKVSTDMFGEFLKNSLIEMGVKTDFVVETKDKKTALAFVSLDNDGERSFEFYREDTADVNFNKDDFKEYWFEGDGIFHFCSNTMTGQNIFEATLHGIEMAKNAGWTISFDVNLRHNLWPENEKPEERVWQAFSHCDVVKLSREELDYLTCENDQQKTIDKILDSGVSLILVTDAGDILECHMNSGSTRIRPPKTKTIDSTAAGDAFMGGFLYRLASQEINRQILTEMSASDANLMENIEFASFCGAYAVTKKGAFTALANQEQLKEFIREYQ